MSFDFKRKRTMKEIRTSLLACADSKCEQCCFYEPDAPTGYRACHDWMMHEQAAEYMMDLIALKNGYPDINEVKEVK